MALPSGGELIPLSIATSVDEAGIIDENSLQVYPNPARNIVNVNYTLGMNASVDFEVYNMVENKVIAISQGYQGADTYSQQLNIKELSNGMYFLRILAGDSQEIRKIKVIN